MLKYLHTIEYNTRINEIIIDFGIDTTLDNGYLVGNSLGTDILGDIPTIKKEVEDLIDLLEGRIELHEGGGNVNLISSDTSFTIIEDIFADSDSNDSTCKIETIEYTKIIIMWAKMNLQYHFQQGMFSAEDIQPIMTWLDTQYLKLYKQTVL